ncbi:MAG: GntR family transcriptional regulator [Acidobacteria bacterium]|nr:GntR family transcriptional regulator [Acidobacteriota bacterium]MBI3489297.1 GntR family transcriptional regulator [Acidobacteriota bacterium]
MILRTTPCIKAITTAGALAERLRNEINAGRWTVGETLRQEELASEFAVSRIPIREALAQLHAEGLIVVEHYRGARIKGLEPLQVEELFDLRLLIEGDLLRRAIPAHTKASVRRLQLIQTQLRHEENRLGWIASDRAFHEALYAPADRPQSLALLGQLRAPVERFSLQQLSPRARQREWDQEHRALISAAAARDTDTALAAIKKHLDGTRAIVLAAACSPQEE